MILFNLFYWKFYLKTWGFKQLAIKKSAFFIIASGIVFIAASQQRTEICLNSAFLIIILQL